MAEKFHNDADKTVYTPRHMSAESTEESTSEQEASPDEAKSQKATSSKKAPAKSASTNKES